LVARVHVTSDKMLHGFGSFPGSPWSLSTSKSTGLEPMPLFNQCLHPRPRLIPLSIAWKRLVIETAGGDTRATNRSFLIAAQ
jgi:hypothetical protein